MKRSQNEIQEAIEVLNKLRKVMPAYDAFGENNHKLIDEELRILDESSKPVEYGDLSAVSDWLNGQHNEWLEDRQCDLRIQSE